MQVKADLSNLTKLIGNVPGITRSIRQKFALDLTTDMQKRMEMRSAVPTPHIITAAPAVHISSAPKPWRRNG